MEHIYHTPSPKAQRTLRELEDRKIVKAREKCFLNTTGKLQSDCDSKHKTRANLSRQNPSIERVK